MAQWRPELVPKPAEMLSCVAGVGSCQLCDLKERVPLTGGPRGSLRPSFSGEEGGVRVRVMAVTQAMAN